MNDNYPFSDRVREALQAIDKDLKWLLVEIDRSERWFYNINDFRKLQLDIVEKISHAVGVNFTTDYNQWLLEHRREPMFIVSEPESGYQVIERKISVNIKIRGNQESIENNLSKMLAIIRKEGRDLGFEIE